MVGPSCSQNFRNLAPPSEYLEGSPGVENFFAFCRVASKSSPALRVGAAVVSSTPKPNRARVLEGDVVSFLVKGCVMVGISELCWEKSLTLCSHLLTHATGVRGTHKDEKSVTPTPENSRGLFLSPRFTSLGAGSEMQMVCEGAGRRGFSRVRSTFAQKSQNFPTFSRTF